MASLQGLGTGPYFPPSTPPPAPIELPSVSPSAPPLPPEHPPIVLQVYNRKVPDLPGGPIDASAPRYPLEELVKEGISREEENYIQSQYHIDCDLHQLRAYFDQYIEHKNLPSLKEFIPYVQRYKDSVKADYREIIKGLEEKVTSLEEEKKGQKEAKDQLEAVLIRLMDQKLEASDVSTTVNEVEKRNSLIQNLEQTIARLQQVISRFQGGLDNFEGHVLELQGDIQIKLSEFGDSVMADFYGEAPSSAPAPLLQEGADNTVQERRKESSWSATCFKLMSVGGAALALIAAACLYHLDSKTVEGWASAFLPLKGE